MNSASTETCEIGLGFCLTLALFAVFPSLDTAVSAHFYTQGSGFYYNRQGWPYWVHHAVPVVGFVLLVSLPTAVLVAFVSERLKAYRKLVVFLTLSLFLGPVVIVNGVLKEYVGRPRPVDVQPFGGSHQFTAVLEQSTACDRNCSFVSGHASLGFFPCVLYVFYRRRVWMVTGLVSGSIVAISRVIAGKHFLSDVVFAFFIVYASALAADALLRWFGRSDYRRPVLNRPIAAVPVVNDSSRRSGPLPQSHTHQGG